MELDNGEGLNLDQFDPAQHLTSNDAIAAYMTDILASGDIALFDSAVNDVMRAKGVAKLTREDTCKALRNGSNLRFETIAATLDALGLALVIVPKESTVTSAAGDDNV